MKASHFLKDPAPVSFSAPVNPPNQLDTETDVDAPFVELRLELGQFSVVEGLGDHGLADVLDEAS